MQNEVKGNSAVGDADSNMSCHQTLWIHRNTAGHV